MYSFNGEKKMDLFLLIVYIAVFCVQIYLLVLAVRRKAKKLWVLLFFSELIPMLIAWRLMKYYDSLPGYGFMPGLCYLGEVLFSYAATILYGACLLISVCCCIVVAKR